MKLHAIMALLGIAITAAAAVFSAIDQQAVPDVLQGRWVTDQPSYETCYIQLTSDFIEVGTQDGYISPGAVIRIYIDKDHKFQRYDIAYYDSAGEESVLSLHYDPSGGGTLRIGSRSNILWYRDNDGYKHAHVATDS